MTGQKLPSWWDMLTHLGQVETLAPVLDPTGYQHGARNLTDQRQVLQAVRHLQVVLDRVAGPVGAPQGGQS